MTPKSGKRRPSPWLALLLVPVAGAAIAWSLRGDEARAPAPPPAKPALDEHLLRQLPYLGRPDDGYAGSDACVACHEAEHASWRRSYHSTMTQPATPETVRPDITKLTLTNAGRTFHVERVGDEYWVDMVDPAWDIRQRERVPGWTGLEAGDHPRARLRIVMTTGSHHMQMYWVESGTGEPRLYIFPFAYVYEDERWLPREDLFIVPPDRGRMVPIWNDNCIRCHSTGGQPGFSHTNQVYNTRVAELGISCEMCHGPAREHVEYYTARKGADPAEVELMHGIVQPLNEDPRLAAQVCGQCHGITGAPTDDEYAAWLETGYRFTPGHDLWETRGITRHRAKFAGPRSEKLPEKNFLLTAELEAHFFWPDGMVRVSGRDYNGLIESPCYQRGDLTCLSCHSMHSSDPNDQLAEGMDTDKACLQCHAEIGADIPAHTHHGEASSGSRCFNCHMPHTVHGLMKSIRSHTISSPNVTESLPPVGRPNACNLCHLDRTLGWTNEHLATWYGAEKLDLAPEHEATSAALAWLFEGDAGQRALIAWHLGWKPAQEASGRDWMTPFLAESLATEPYAVVRYMANRSMRTMPFQEGFTYDYIAPIESRSESARLAYERWRQRKPAKLDRHGPHLLVTEDGDVDREGLGRLHEKRDDRRVFLAE